MLSCCHSINLTCRDTQALSISFVRRQYPVRLAFALTIHRSQGQSFDRVRLLLHDPVFVHGQLCLALSPAPARDRIRVIIGERAWGNLDEAPNTPNIVWPEILYLPAYRSFLACSCAHVYVLCNI